MLKVKGLYKEEKNNVIRNVNIDIEKGSSVSIECSNELSDLLLNLILGKTASAKGEIFIDNVRNTDYIKKNIQNIGVIFRDDAFYERETVQTYLKFFKDVLQSKVDYKEVMSRLGIFDIGSVKIKDLGYSQRRRLSLAREMLKQPELLIFQEPILNMDRDGARIIVENIERLQSLGTS